MRRVKPRSSCGSSGCGAECGWQQCQNVRGKGDGLKGPMVWSVDGLTTADGLGLG